MATELHSSHRQGRAYASSYMVEIIRSVHSPVRYSVRSPPEQAPTVTLTPRYLTVLLASMEFGRSALGSHCNELSLEGGYDLARCTGGVSS